MRRPASNEGIDVGFIRKIFGKGEDTLEEEYVEEVEEFGELDYEEPVAPKALSEKAITVKPMDLRDAADIEQVLNEINEGNIVILRYDDLSSPEDQEKLRFIIQRLKERVLEMGGDLVMIRPRVYPPILIVPRFVEIWKRPE